ncbi:MAG: cell division protein SepF [Veillonella sp.]|nr:cell division protein SepF [Veillonella sp.]MCF0156701.1 cell division protein SepF [Veillonella sp.]
MAFSELWEKTKKTIGLNNPEYDYDDDEYEYEEEEAYGAVEAPEAAAPVAAAAASRKVGGATTMTQRPTAMKVIVIEPKTFEDSATIVDQLRGMRPVLVNFENTDPREAARVVDFISGATYALDGHLEKVGKDIFMCVPSNITIDHNEETGKTEIGDQFAWNKEN